MTIKKFFILTINPGSTSTKIAIFKGEDKVLSETLSHPLEELLSFEKVADQFEYRKKTILEYLDQEKISMADFDAVVGRGGLLKPVSGGTYLINETMLKDLQSGQYGEHASDLGAMIAWHLAKPHSIPSYIVNPIVVDELDDIARISGMPEIPRRSIFHALNQKAVAINYAESQNKEYTQGRYIVVHLGGGISVGAHQNGRVIDVNNALYGEGPFSPERSGAVPIHDVINMAYSGKYTQVEMHKKVVGKGGFIAYLGTNDARNVVKSIEAGDKESELIYQALAYQVAKEIGSAATVLKGQVDAIIITGGMAHDQSLISLIKERINFIGQIEVMPGEKEMEALADGARRVLLGKEQGKEYS